MGSAHSEPKVVAILSAVESCRRLGVSAKENLLAVLLAMARRKLSEVTTLTPARWALARGSPGFLGRIVHQTVSFGNHESLARSAQSGNVLIAQSRNVLLTTRRLGRCKQDDY